jgi:hypothetical protein
MDGSGTRAVAHGRVQDGSSPDRGRVGRVGIGTRPHPSGRPPVHPSGRPPVHPSSRRVVLSRHFLVSPMESSNLNFGCSPRSSARGPCRHSHRTERAAGEGWANGWARWLGQAHLWFQVPRSHRREPRRAVRPAGRQWRGVLMSGPVDTCNRESMAQSWPNAPKTRWPNRGPMGKGAGSRGNARMAQWPNHGPMPILGRCGSQAQWPSQSRRLGRLGRWANRFSSTLGDPS